MFELFEVLEWVDERILALFTKFSHWFQRLTGLTNFFLARVCLFLVVTEMIMELFNYWFHFLSTKTTVADVAILSVIVLLLLAHLPLLHQADEQVCRNNTAKPEIQYWFESGSAGVAMIFARVISVFLIVSALPLLVGYLFFKKPEKNVVWILEVYARFGLVYLTAFLYFVLVNPLPPGKSKVREWVEAIGASLRRMMPATQSG